jgi:hypothetical protein
MKDISIWRSARAAITAWLAISSNRSANFLEDRQVGLVLVDLVDVG